MVMWSRSATTMSATVTEVPSRRAIFLAALITTFVMNPCIANLACGNTFPLRRGMPAWLANMRNDRRWKQASCPASQKEQVEGLPPSSPLDVGWPQVHHGKLWLNIVLLCIDSYSWIESDRQRFLVMMVLLGDYTIALYFILYFPHLCVDQSD